MPVKRRTSKARGRDLARAVQIFDQMTALPCTCRPDADSSDECSGCRRWWQLEHELRRALVLPLWEFPTVARWPPDRRRTWPDDDENSRYLMLEAISAAKRAERAKAAPDSA
jgi:hypothetical protein